MIHPVKDDEDALSWKYLEFFFLQHPELETKKGDEYDVGPNNWCTYKNSCGVYDSLCNCLVKTKIAVRLPGTKWVDAEYNTVPTKDRAIGHMVEHKLTHAEYLLFVK